MLTFEGNNHSKTLAGVEALGGHSNVGLPSLNWVQCDFPNIKYPLNENEKDNKEEEEWVIKNFRKIIKERKSTVNPVRAVVIEPVTFFGHKIATPTFYKTLREICSEKHIPFIVDETRSGVGITGKYWGHEHWYLENSPDIVIFGRAT